MKRGAAFFGKINKTDKLNQTHQERQRPRIKSGKKDNGFLSHIKIKRPLPPWTQELLARHVSKGKGNKSKNELLALHQDNKLLHGKANNQPN